MTESFINKNGTLPRDLLSSIVQYMRKSKGKLVSISWKSVKPTRSLLLNRYYWGVVIAYLSKEIGYSPEIMHQYMKDKFLTPVRVDMPDGGGMNWRVSTTTLNNREFDDYIQEIRNWAGEFLSLDIPLPNQTQFDYTGFE